jgi:thiamine biosynthesis lipoprotein
MSRPAATGWLRRAQPLLGTLVEIGLAAPGDAPGDDLAILRSAFQAAFGAVRAAQAALSRFEPGSDISRFHALPRGGRLIVRPVTAQVLTAAQALQAASAGLFDISLGSAPEGWALDGLTLTKLHPATQLDLGGIGKGHAVDTAVQALREAGFTTGWVNAGGDLRAFGDVDVPVQLRDEATGGVRPFARLRDGAFATSAFGSGHRARLAAGVKPHPAGLDEASGGQCRHGAVAHVSVCAALCLWADALTKVVAASGDVQHPLLAQHGARAWWHSAAASP